MPRKYSVGGFTIKLLNKYDFDSIRSPAKCKEYQCVAEKRYENLKA